MLIKSLADLIAAAAVRRADAGVATGVGRAMRRGCASRAVAPDDAKRSVWTSRAGESERRIVVAAVLLGSILLLMATAQALAPRRDASLGGVAGLHRAREEASGPAHADTDAQVMMSDRRLVSAFHRVRVLAQSQPCPRRAAERSSRCIRSAS